MKPRTPVEIPKLLEWLGIKARRRGAEWWACCPIHGEHEPSLQIRDDKDGKEHGLWRCFGCGAKGNSIQLTSEVLGVDYRTAQAMMTEHGMFGAAPPLPTTVVVESSTPRRGFAMPPGVEFPSWEQWLPSPKRYVLSRGITQQQVEKWGIGYAASGVLGGRIVIPVRDTHGVLCGYSARSFIGSLRRYLEASVAEGYDPGVMFGENFWPDPAVRRVILLTEGSINALAVERALDVCPDFDTVVPPVGAVRGSQLHAGHIASLASFRMVLVASDPDPAGDKLYGLIASALASSCIKTTVRRVSIPKGKDAADMPVDELMEAILCQTV